MIQSNPFKNDIISQKILDQVGPNRSQIASRGLVKHRKQSVSRDYHQSKQKSSQEIAIQQLTQLHDKYFGQSTKQNHVFGPSNITELPNDTFQTVFRGRQIAESNDRKPQRPVQKRNSYEVEPPQIIQQINASVKITNNQSGGGSNDLQRLKQSNTSLNVLLGENGASFLSRTKEQGLGLQYGIKRDINILNYDQAGRNQSQGYKSRNATNQASKSHKEHRSAEMAKEAPPTSNQQVHGRPLHVGQPVRTQGKLMDFKEIANQRQQMGNGQLNTSKQGHLGMKARRQLPNMEKSLKALQKERANSLNAVKLNNFGRVIDRVEDNQRERSSPTKKQQALINECWSADPSKIHQTEPDELQEDKPKIMLFSGINYGGKPTLYDDVNEFFQKEADLERSDFETDEMSEQLHTSLPLKSIVRDSKEIFQPESYTRNWLMKHGKDEQVYFDQKQIHKIKDFFEQLDTDNKGYVEIQDLEDMLVSLGLITQRQEIEVIMQHLQKKKIRQQAVYQSDTAIKQMSEKQFASAISSSVAISKINQLKISFEMFLLILKEAQVRNKRGINGNYLLDKNIFFQKVDGQPKKVNKLPQLQEKSLPEARKGSAALLDGCCKTSSMTAGVSQIEQYNGNGQSNFFKSLRKSDVYSGQATSQRTHKNRQSKSFEIQTQQSNGQRHETQQNSKNTGYQMRSKIKQTMESSMPEAYQSNLSTFNIDSVLQPQSNERNQSTMNKATFIHGTEKTVEPTQGELIEFKKTNGQALYINSKPKIKQFFQNLSSNSSILNIQQQNLLLQSNQKPELSSCMNKFKHKTRSQQLSHRQKFKKGVARSHERGQPEIADRYLSQSQVQIPFRLLMSNFRRKMIIDTLQDSTTSQEHKNQILTPYQEYLTKQSQLISDKDNQYYFDYGEELSANASDNDFGFNAQTEAISGPKSKQSIPESKGTSKAALELERTLKKQVWSIKRRRLLKEGQDVSRKYRSTGSFDRQHNQKLFKEMLIQADQEAVINEEVSAELSVQESSKYTEVVSKPQSELKVSDEASEKCDSKSYTMISSPKIMIDTQRARAIKLKSPNQLVRVQQPDQNKTVLNDKPVYVFKHEMQPGSNYRDQEALDEIETQRTKSMKNLLQKQISQETNQSKAYPKLDQSDIDTKTAKGSRSCGSEDALGNAREFIFEQDIDKKGFQDGDIPRKSEQASPKIVPEDQQQDDQSQTTNQSPPEESRNQSQLPQQYSLNCENYLKKQNSNKIKTQSRNKETARALYGSKKTNKDIKQLIRQNSKKTQQKNKVQSDLDCLAQQETNKSTNQAAREALNPTSRETDLPMDGSNLEKNEGGLANDMMSGFSKYIDEAIARQLQALSQHKNTDNGATTLQTNKNADQLPGSIFWQSSELSKIAMVDVDWQQQIRGLRNIPNEQRAAGELESEAQQQMGEQQKKAQQVNPMIIQQFFVNINNSQAPNGAD